MSHTLTKIAQRLDALAIGQLRAEVIRLSSLLEAAERRAEEAEYQRLLAEDHAEFWYDATAALREELAEQIRLGITQDGQPIALPCGEEIEPQQEGETP